MAATSEEVSARGSTVAAATEELTASVGEIGRQVEQSTRNAGQTKLLALNATIEASRRLMQPATTAHRLIGRNS